MMKISGQRGGYYYHYQGFSYNRKKNNDHLFYCTSRTGNLQCPGQAISLQNEVQIKILHNHDQKTLNLPEIVAKDEIYQDCCENTDRLKIIFDDYRTELVNQNYIYTIRC